jgi:hypothetical protein
VVAPRELTGLFDGDNVAGVLHHAYRGGVAAIIEANGAEASLGDIETSGAERDALFDGDDRLSQPESVFRRHLEQVEGDPLCRLGPDTRKPPQFVDQ